jgi:PelA/Pel-15E family pectate lyase
MLCVPMTRFVVTGTARQGLVVMLAAHAAVIGANPPIGQNTPAMSLTEARVMALPAGERGPWLEYVRRSQEQMRRDKAALAAERAGMTTLPGMPKSSGSAHSIPTRRDAAFYRSDEARHIAEVVLSFQTPGGGWSKNLDMGAAVRQRGQIYAGANLSPVPGSAKDFDKPLDENWHYISTLDNDATNTELHFLAEMSAAWPGPEGDGYRASALRGFEYLLRSQYPNGGWPQVWPLEGGYHDAITFNDDAVTESAETLRDVAGTAVGAEKDAAPEDYSFVPEEMRARARAAVAKALEIILKTQIKVPAADGKGTVLTVWAQQFDPLTLTPVSARNYEMPALCSDESAGVMEYLMTVERPSAEVVRAIEAAAGWFEAHKIVGFEWTGGRWTPGGRQLVAKAGAGPLWARYYSLTTQKPIFGDRDKSIHDDVMEISLERRNGYGWYGRAPEEALEQYAEWKKAGNRD